MNAASHDQVHSLWITTWSEFNRFSPALDSKKTQDAMTSNNGLQPNKKNPFWMKLESALWELVEVPVEPIGTIQFAPSLPPSTTGEWLRSTTFAYSPKFPELLPKKQDEFVGNQPFSRKIFPSDEFELLGCLTKTFPTRVSTPFMRTPGEPEPRLFPLPLLDVLASQAGLSGKAVIQNPELENVFWVKGIEDPIMISLRKKLNQWKIRQIHPGDSFHFPEVHYFS